MPRRVAPGGMVFHVLNRGNAGMQVFEQDSDYRAFEGIVGDVLDLLPMRVLSYCLMPTHWHFVLWPREDGELAAFMHRVTVTHVRRWHEHRESTGRGHLYQGPYKSFPVQDGGHFLTVCRYVERNALRAGLVEKAEDWRWGSLWHRENASEQAQQLLNGWPLERQPDYVQWVNQPQTATELEALRTCVTRGRPFGDDTWLWRIAGRLGLESTLRGRGRPPKVR